MKQLWSRSFVAVFVTNMMTGFCFYILLAILPAFVDRELGLGTTQVGWVIGAFTITAVLARPFAGMLLDSVGRLRIYRPALIFFTVCVALYTSVSSLFLLLILRAFHGVWWGAVGTAGSTIATDIIPPERRAEGLGYYAISLSLGMALGPAAGIFLMDRMAFQQVFIICAILALGAALAGFTIKIKPMEYKKPSLALSALFEGNVWGIAVMQLFFGIAYGSVVAFVILYGEKLGIHSRGIFFLIYSVILIAMRPLIGCYLDKRGPGHLMGAGYIFLIAGFIVLGMAQGSLFFFGAAVIIGMGGGIVMPIQVAMAMNLVPPRRRGVANATIFTAFDIGIGGGAILLGMLADNFSMSTMYIISSGILFIPLLFYYLYESNHYSLLKKQMDSLT